MWGKTDDVVCVALGFVELRAMIARRLSGRTAARARRFLDRLWASVDVVPIDDRLLEDAAAAADTHRLRALDALHLAAALEAHDRALVLATWDRELRFAAQRAGLPLFPP